MQIHISGHDCEISEELRRQAERAFGALEEGGTPLGIVMLGLERRGERRAASVVCAVENAESVAAHAEDGDFPALLEILRARVAEELDRRSRAPES